MGLKYSKNPEDWKIQHTCCDKVRIYTDFLTYCNSMRRLDVSGILRCRKHQTVGIKHSIEAKRNMSVAAKVRTTTPENEAIRSKKISEANKLRYANMPREERRILNSKILHGQWNKSQEKIDEWMLKRSIARKSEMLRTGKADKFAPSYNKSTIPYIGEVLNTKYKTIFINAESDGGEFRIYDRKNQRFYYADAYCPKLNIWIEFDESYHTANDNIIKEDILRQKRIEDILKCTFIRIQMSDIQLVTY